MLLKYNPHKTENLECEIYKIYKELPEGESICGIDYHNCSTYNRKGYEFHITSAKVRVMYIHVKWFFDKIDGELIEKGTYKRLRYDNIRNGIKLVNGIKYIKKHRTYKIIDIRFIDGDFLEYGTYEKHKILHAHPDPDE